MFQHGRSLSGSFHLARGQSKIPQLHVRQHARSGGSWFRHSRREHRTQKRMALEFHHPHDRKGQGPDDMRRQVGGGRQKQLPPRLHTPPQHT